MSHQYYWKYSLAIVYVNTPIYVTRIKTEDVSGTTAMIEHLEISQGG